MLSVAAAIAFVTAISPFDGFPVEATALPTTGPVTIDGRLDEPAWTAAPVYRAVWQRKPREGRPVECPTEFRVMYTPEALYVGVTALDTQSANIAAVLTR